MIKLYFAPRTRSVRILWLLEELGLPYELARVDFLPTATKFFIQQTPTGKLPTIEDGDIVMSESGAITEYILERYGNGRLAPPVGSPARAKFLQWMHFADSTLFAPLGVLVWLTLYRQDSDQYPQVIQEGRERAATGFEYLERELGEKTWLLGDEFSAADIMMGFTLFAGSMLGILDDRYPRLNAYLGRLQARPAFQKALAAG